MSERRQIERQRCYLKAQVLADGRTTSDCIARNLSGAGAMISHIEAWRLPDSFKLELTSRGEIIDATVAWRERERMGLVFGARIRRAA